MAKFTVQTTFRAVDGMTKPLTGIGRAAKNASRRMNAAFASTERRLTSLQKRTSGLVKGIFNLRNAAGVMIAGAAIKKTVDLANNVAAIGDEASKTGRMLGVTAEFLQEMRFAAERQGITSEDLTSSLEKLNKNVGEAQLGQGMLSTMLKRTNPQLLKQVTSAENNQEAFDIMVDAIAKAPNQMQKTAMSQAAFGRAGAKMLKMIEAGPEGLAALRAEAGQYGEVIGNDAAAGMEKYIDTQRNTQAVTAGVKNQIGMALMPTVEKVMKRIISWTTANKELIQVKIAAFVKGLTNVLKFLHNNMDRIVKILKIAGIALAGLLVVSKLIAIFTTFVAVIKGITAAVAIFNAVMALNPFSWVILAVVALIAGIVLLVKHWDVVKAAIVGFVETAVSWIDALIDKIKSVAK